MPSLPYAKNLLFFVFASSRGGENRARIMNTLQNSPRNANQLANDLGLNYRAIQHHLEVLEKNNLITKIGEKYGATWFVSPFFEANKEAYDELISKTYGGIK
ncbi:MAG TPA: winged helix-turn-helix domain-containing protein [Candidatus Nitrosotalea sp.]|nr:winged helix-turn-helix domain-containing protein [Candidatus Nitrosotalea sp.]